MCWEVNVESRFPPVQHTVVQRDALVIRGRMVSAARIARQGRFVRGVAVVGHCVRAAADLLPSRTSCGLRSLSSCARSSVLLLYAGHVCAKKKNRALPLQGALGACKQIRHAPTVAKIRLPLLHPYVRHMPTGFTSSSSFIQLCAIQRSVWA